MILNYSNIKRLTRTLYLLLITILFSHPTNAQNIQISGKVVDSTTLKPLVDVNIYIANTTLWTKTDQNGTYTFSNLLSANYRLLVSCIGYHTIQADLSAIKGRYIANFDLKQKSIELNEVVISPGNWEVNLTTFKREFIGVSNSKDCRILNPNILNLYFNRNANILTANTSDFLDIENDVLGYKLRFLIKDFSADFNTRRVHYSGTVIFEELSGKKAELKKWAKKRIEVYNSSFKHFLISLSRGGLSKDKFIVYNLIRTTNPQWKTDSLQRSQRKLATITGNRGRQRKRMLFNLYPKTIDVLGKEPLQEKDIMQLNQQDSTYNLQFPGYIYVIDQKNKVYHDMDDLYRFNEAKDYQISAISLKNSLKPTIFNGHGILISKESILYEGAWSGRIVNLLPDDYEPYSNN